MKKHKLTILASILASLSTGAFAADKPFFTITEISDNPDEYGFKLAQKADIYSNQIQPYDWWSYYDSIPTEVDLSERHIYSVGCIYDSAVCNSFYDPDVVDDNMSHSFYKALHNNESFKSSTLSYGDTLDLFGGIRRDLGTDGTSMITGYVYNSDRSFDTGVSYPVVWSNGKKVVLEQKKGYGLASSSLLIDDGSYLIGGASSETDFTTSSYYYYCYTEYDEDTFFGNMRNCTGYSNEPVLWAFDPSSNTVTQKQVLEHYKKDDLDDKMNMADIKSIVKYNDQYFAFGFSATKDLGWDSISIASYWTFNYEDGTFTNVSEAINPDGIDRPGKDDDHYGATWFVEANDQGYAIGNIRYTTPDHLAYPVKMFIFDLETKKGRLPLDNVPFKGATNRAVAINNNNLVVGVSDQKDSQSATVNGMPREHEGFLYNIKTDRFYSINDLICSSETCEINGKYYYIYNIGDINDDNTIIANAYRYDSQEDWSKYRNAQNVTITLTSDKFTDDFAIPSEYVVGYNRAEITYGEESGGGGGSGSFDLLSLLGLGTLTALRFRKKKLK